MKKVEVYFLINLGAILSLFAIEGELAVYMSRQNDILKNVAQDKLQDLVEISNVESNYDDPDYYRLFFDVDGQYEKGSIVELDIKSLEPRLYLKLVKGIDVVDAYTFLLTEVLEKQIGDIERKKIKLVGKI